MQDIEILQELIVLYVEDEELTRRSIGKLIQRRVKEVVLAENGEDGFAKFKEKNPDIVITDIEMPIMNGIEMVKLIKEIDINRPIIVVSAFQDEAHKCDSADYTLVKPVDKDELIRAIVESYKNFKNL